MAKNLLSFLFLLSISFYISAQSMAEYCIQVDAEVSESPAQIHLSWFPLTGATSYTVFRKLAHQSSWGPAIYTGSDTSYVDTAVSPGVLYEYKIQEFGNSFPGFGYIQSGMNIQHDWQRGDALLLVEAEVASQLSDLIDATAEDYRADGWNTHVEVIAADTTVAYVKDVILGYNQTVDSLATLFIIGHVPVPYSGNLAPDAHSNHVGAWPADPFYGDIDGTWEDQWVTNTTASDPRNHNIPGDGKYDESVIPGNGRMELQVGRIDFANLSNFAEDEIELTRRYLQRAHDYKHKGWTLEKRGLIDNNFGAMDEVFASNGWRNFAPLVGKENLVSADYRTTMANEEYLFSYGCGGGSFTSAGGIGNSTQLAGDSLLTGFTMLFGSYFGDWDRESNFMRSALAQGRSLSICWAGRPWWFFHPMGMGATLGECARMSQNNTNHYFSSYGAQFVHTALLGDPSLRMEYIAPPTALQIDTTDIYHISLSWTASGDMVDGYDIYYRDQNNWMKANEALITNTSFIDSCVLSAGVKAYRVQAVRLVESPSGTYWNRSLTITDSIEVLSDKEPMITAHSITQIDPFLPPLLFLAQGSWVESYSWSINGGASIATDDSAEIDLFEVPEITSPFTYEITGSNACESTTQNGTGEFQLGGIESPKVDPLVVYPNPNKTGLFWLEKALPNSSYRVIDLTGKIVATDRVQGNQIDLQRLAPGTYSLEVYDQQVEQRTTIVLYD